MLVPRDYQEEAVDKLFSFFANNGVCQSTGGPTPANPLVLMPTGTGKSIVIGRFVQRVMRSFPGQRLLILTHVKELIEQNSSKLALLDTTLPYGVYSAGLKQKDTLMPVTFGGVGSVVKRLDAFGRIDLIAIDEAHLVSTHDDAMYSKVIAHFTKLNPWLRVVGFSATGWRIGQGLLTDGGVFTHVAADYTTPEQFAKFIAQGYLVPPIPKRTASFIDVSNVKVVRGEYDTAQLNAAADNDDITYKALSEACELGADRQCWLAFCTSIEHAEHVATALQTFGVSAVAVHSKMPGAERDARIAAFKRGEFKCLTNNGIFTTGQDHPPIDMIIGLRPTASASLYVQMVGRGMRPSPGKENCLYLDFARNAERLGTVDDPKIPKKPGEKTAGDMPVRICEACGVYNHARARVCINCGAEFSTETKLVQHASTAELLKDKSPILEYFAVDRIYYSRHQKTVKQADGSRTPIGPPMLKASYACGLSLFNEYVLLEHDGPMQRKALGWWHRRFPTAWEPKTVDEALTYIQHVRAPQRIKVWTNKPYPEIVGYDFGVMTDATHGP